MWMITADRTRTFHSVAFLPKYFHALHRPSLSPFPECHVLPRHPSSPFLPSSISRKEPIFILRTYPGAPVSGVMGHGHPCLAIKPRPLPSQHPLFFSHTTSSHPTLASIFGSFLDASRHLLSFHSHHEAHRSLGITNYFPEPGDGPRRPRVTGSSDSIRRFPGSPTHP